MKKIYTIIICMLVAATSSMAQGLDGLSKSEYRYWNFVIGLNHGFGGAMGDGDASMLLHSDKGDLKNEKKGFTYTPGYHVGFVYNYDLKNNKTGIVAGLEVTNYGVKNKYTANDIDYNVKQTYRALGITVPILFKFSSEDIYRDMKYICIGVKPTINLSVMEGQKASWNDEKFGTKVDNKNSFSCAATLGFNYNIYSFNINYMFLDLVNKDSGFKGHIFLCTSLNIPMTRWLCIHNWTAEKIRRKIKNGKSL